MPNIASGPVNKAVSTAIITVVFFSFIVPTAHTVSSRGPHASPGAATDRSQRKVALIEACDQLASSPFDGDRPLKFSGIPFDEIKSDRAISACEAATKAEASERRLFYQFGRALDAGQKFVDAKLAYEQAIKLGHGLAINNLGLMYYQGRGVLKDKVVARLLFEKGVSLNLAPAMHNLGRLIAEKANSEDFITARGLYERAAKLGHISAMTDLGSLIYDGLGGSADRTAGLAWLEKAASLGNPTAMTMLGRVFSEIQYGPTDYLVARNWFSKAADIGHAKATVYLGRMFEYGHGIPVDYNTARRWYEKGAALGEPSAMTELAGMYLDGMGVPVSLKTAQQWCEKAIALGDDDAKSCLNLVKSIRSGR